MAAGVIAILEFSRKNDQVDDARFWPLLNEASNLAFVKSAVARLRVCFSLSSSSSITSQARGVRPGIYTAHQNWETITGGQDNCGSDVLLW